MNQPPDFPNVAPNQTNQPSTRDAGRRPHWRRPQGVAPGTWEYVNERSIADRYDAFVAETPLCRLDQRVLENLLPPLNPNQHRHEIVLDLGCGSGRSALPLADRGYTVVGIDLSQGMLEMMSGKTVSGVGRIWPLRANLVQLDCLADDSADHAICLFSTLGMIQGRMHRRQMLRHAARVVRPGGNFLVHVHHRWAALREHLGVRTLARSWWRSVRRGECEFGDTTYAYRGLEQMFMHRFSKRELLSDLAKSGYHVTSFWPVTIDGSEFVSGLTIPGGFLIHAVIK